MIVQVVREHEFAPVKNAPGSATDSPDTARALVLGEHTEWLKQAGVILNEKAENAVEISSSFSVNGEGLEKLAGKKLNGPKMLTESTKVGRGGGKMAIIAGVVAGVVMGLKK